MNKLAQWKQCRKTDKSLVSTHYVLKYCRDCNVQNSAWGSGWESTTALSKAKCYISFKTMPGVLYGCTKGKQYF